MAHNNQRGGRPKGAKDKNPGGRPKGSKSVVTREVARRIAVDGNITPLEVMVTAMRNSLEGEMPDYRKVVDAARELVDALDSLRKAVKGRSSPELDGVMEAMAVLWSLLEPKKPDWGLAHSYAKDAAPYLHAKLQSTMISGDQENPLKTVNLTPEEFREVATRLLRVV